MSKEDVVEVLESILKVKPSNGRIKFPQDLIPHLSGFSSDSVENFLGVSLDGSHKVISVNQVSKGTVNRSIVHPREVFKQAILDNAVAVIIAHNHPSSTLDPSTEDIDVTSRLKEAGELIGIPVLDHLIIHGNSYFSFLEHGIL